jgi:hypothetical protein
VEAGQVVSQDKVDDSIWKADLLVIDVDVQKHFWLTKVDDGLKFCISNLIWKQLMLMWLGGCIKNYSILAPFLHIPWGVQQR